MMGRPSFEGWGEKKINVYTFGCCSYVIYPNRLSRVKQLPLSSAFKASKEDGQKSGPSYPNYTVPAGHRHWEEFKGRKWS